MGLRAPAFVHLNLTRDPCPNRKLWNMEQNVEKSRYFNDLGCSSDKLLLEQNTV